MCDVLELLEDAISSAYDAVYDAVAAVWNDVVTPMLEEVFSWFGIEDELALFVNKTSVALYADNDVDVVHQANVKSVMSMVQNGGSFFPWYMQYTRQTQAQIKSYYKYAFDERYIHGLPTMSVKGADIDYAAIDLAVADDLGFAITRLRSTSTFPSDEIYFKNKLQAAPYYYLPWANTLTHTDPWSVSWDDYTLDDLIYNAGPNTWDQQVSRVAEEALFWISGPVHVVEGDTATYTVTSNRAVPVGESVTVNITYGGTASGSDYTAVASAVMAAGDTTVDFDVVTNEDAIAQGSRTMILTLASVTNTNAAFEAVGVWTQDEVTTTITDDEGIILTMPSVLVTEASGSATVVVKLEEAAAGTFDVDYAFTDGTALGGGIDYTSTSGTLTFAGTAGETQNIAIPITTDAADDMEYFTVYFSACDDPAVDITQTCTVTITDGSTEYPAAGTVVLTDLINWLGYTPESTMIVTYHASADPATEWFYWLYEYSDGTYPDIKPSMSIMTNLEMLPVGILRKDKVSINGDKTTAEYKTTKRLLDFLQLDIDDMIDNIEENPDIADIDDVFINFSVSPNDTVEVVSKILWLTYHNIIVINTVTSNSNRYTASFEEQDVQNSVVWTDHSYTADNVGTLASGQDYEHEIVQIPLITHEDPETGETIVDQEEGSKLYVRYQTAAGLYDEIIMVNLNGFASIEYDGFHKYAVNKLGDDQFTIPISYFILDQFDHFEQMKIYQYLLRLDIYSAQLAEIAWYESDSFLLLFQFAMIVITVVTAGAAASVWAVLQQMIINFLIIEAVIYLAELTGNAELAAIVGLVAMVALSYTGAGMAFDMTSAEGLIQVSTKFADNLTTAYDVLSQEVGQEIKDVNEAAEARLEEIGDATPEDSPITAEFLVALKSIDTIAFPAIKAQYDFDLLYNYDTIIADYHNNHLRTGVI